MCLSFRFSFFFSFLFFVLLFTQQRIMMLIRGLVALLFVSLAFSQSEWVGDHIANPSNEQLEKWGEMLLETGHVHVPHFLTLETRKHFLKEIDFVGMSPVLQRTTVFQDHGDSENFTSSHPRNFRMERTLHFSSRQIFEEKLCGDETSSDCSRIVSLYNSPIIYDFWLKVIEKSQIKRNIYVSNDVLGSVYALKIEPGGAPEGSWHFDEHIYSCVLMLQKPTEGGYLLHSKFPSAWAHSYDSSWKGWEDMSSLLFSSSEEVEKRMGEEGGEGVFKVEAGEGDAYCFFGDEELHNIVQVGGEKDRIVVVFAFSGTPSFSHSGNVHDNNQWDQDPSSSEDCEMK